jgi:hypothetical protein
MEKVVELKYYAEKQGKGIGESGEVYIAGSRLGLDGAGAGAGAGGPGPKLYRPSSPDRVSH